MGVRFPGALPPAIECIPCGDFKRERKAYSLLPTPYSLLPIAHCRLPIADRLLLTADCLLLAAFYHPFVGRRVVHIEEDAGVRDFHKLRRAAVFADDRVGRFYGWECQQLRKQCPANDDGVATLALIGRDKDRRAGRFETLN